LQPVLQLPIVGLQGLHEGVEGVVLVPVPVALGAQLSGRLYLSRARPSSSCRQQTRCRRTQSQKTRKHKGDKGASLESAKKHVPGNPPRGTPVDP
jgi:hypothetical protein